MALGSNHTINLGALLATKLTVMATNLEDIRTGFDKFAVNKSLGGYLRTGEGTHGI